MRPLCGVALPESGPWRQAWRTDYDAGGVRDMVRYGGWLWVATPHDVLRLDPGTFDCTRFSLMAGESDVLSNVYALLPDPEGRLWAAGPHGLARFDGQDWQIIRTDTPQAYGLAFDAAGNLWALQPVDGGRYGMTWFRYSGHEPPGDGQWERERPLTPPREDDCDQWVAMSDVFSFPGSRFRSPEECRLLAAWRQRLASLVLPAGIAPWDGNPVSMSTDGAGRLWMLARHLPDQSGYDTLLVFDGHKWQALPWPYGYTGLPVADEARGGVWIGTTEGLAFSDSRGLRKFLLSPGDLVPFGPGVYDLVADKSGHLWVSTERGLLHYDEAADTWGPTEIGETVLLLPDDRGGLWVASRDRFGRVSHFDGKTWSHYPFPAGWPCLPDDILGDAGGGLWLSSHDCVLRGFNGAMWDEYDSGSRGDRLFRGPTGDVCAATWDGAVRQYDGAIWKMLLPPDPLHGVQVTALAVGRAGEVWVAFNARPGLLVYRDGMWESVRDMADEAIGALLVDTRGDLWASTDRGLLHYDGKTWESVEGVMRFAIALAEDRQGRIWMGGQDGLGVYDPRLE